MFGWLRRRRRARLRAQPFPAAWRAIVERNVPYFRRLPLADQAELLGHTQVLLAEKSFEGCGGLELTDEMRVTIAAQASVLLLHRDTEYFPRVSSVLVYPSTYVSAEEEELLPDGTVLAGADARLGESWVQGAVVLAWDASLTGAVHPRDGDNVILHEFAHQLDQDYGHADGLPRLPRRELYREWAEVFAREFAELQRDAERGRRRRVLDPYGATNPAEFFAVATEAFFERGPELKRRHPELYRLLQAFYLQDPAEL